MHSSVGLRWRVDNAGSYQELYGRHESRDNPILLRLLDMEGIVLQLQANAASYFPAQN